MQSVTCRTRYSPRAWRAGVLSNLRVVSARARGPMNGRQPIVSVIPAAKTTASAGNPAPAVFPNLVIFTAGTSF